MSVSEQDKATLNTEVVNKLTEMLKEVDFVAYFMEVIQENNGNLVDVEDAFSDGYYLDEFLADISFQETLSDIFIDWLNKAEIQITISL